MHGNKLPDGMKVDFFFFLAFPFFALKNKPTFSHTYDLKYIITLQVNSRNDTAFNLAFSIEELPKKTLIAQFKLPWKP